MTMFKVIATQFYTQVNFFEQFSSLISNYEFQNGDSKNLFWPARPVHDAGQQEAGRSTSRFIIFILSSNYKLLCQPVRGDVKKIGEFWEVRTTSRKPPSPL